MVYKREYILIMHFYNNTYTDRAIMAALLTPDESTLALSARLAGSALDSKRCTPYNIRILIVKQIGNEGPALKSNM